MTMTTMMVMVTITMTVMNEECEPSQQIGGSWFGQVESLRDSFFRLQTPHQALQGGIHCMKQLFVDWAYFTMIIDNRRNLNINCRYHLLQQLSFNITKLTKIMIVTMTMTKTMTMTMTMTFTIAIMMTMTLTIAIMMTMRMMMTMTMTLTMTIAMAMTITR